MMRPVKLAVVLLSKRQVKNADVRFERVKRIQRRLQR
jgi:hypothetical protein